jgi:hypothetical protein
MKVRINLTVAVDHVEWAETYGLGDDPDNPVDQAEIRDDVQRWAANALSHHPDGLIELVSVNA